MVILWFQTPLQSYWQDKTNTRLIFLECRLIITWIIDYVMCGVGNLAVSGGEISSTSVVTSGSAVQGPELPGHSSFTLSLVNRPKSEDCVF